MKIFNFSYKDTAPLAPADLQTLGKTLAPEIAQMQQAATQGYVTAYASINLPNDEHMLAAVQAVVQEKQQLQPSILIVVGIGGSNLGALAVHQALQGMQYNESSPAMRVYWADTVDAEYMHTIMHHAQLALKNNQRILITIISKSGCTIETAANAQLLLALLKQYHPTDYSNYVVVITDAQSPLWRIAQQEKWVHLQIPKLVGGRYSVLSPAGLFPLAMLGIDIKQLLDGARFIMPQLLSMDIAHNPAAMSAIILAYFYRQGKTIHDTFLFSVSCESLGKWYRQLLGESIGKKHTKHGVVAHVGITSTVSVGSTDLHSVGQLYIGGPRDKVTTFITLDAVNHDMVVPALPEYQTCIQDIQDKTLATIMRAIIQGVQKTYQQEGLPFMHIALPEKSAFYVGQVLQCKMIEIMYLGYLLEVNPFDQPNVELYKQETQAILARE